jgi:hypothetical protein
LLQLSALKILEFGIELLLFFFGKFVDDRLDASHGVLGVLLVGGFLRNEGRSIRGVLPLLGTEAADMIGFVTVEAQSLAHVFGMFVNGHGVDVHGVGIVMLCFVSVSARESGDESVRRLVGLLGSVLVLNRGSVWHMAQDGFHLAPGVIQLGCFLVPVGQGGRDGVELEESR